MARDLPTDRFEREWAWYLEIHGHRVTRRRPRASGVVRSRGKRGHRYRWLLRSEAGDSVLLSAAARKELRRQHRLARKAGEQCFLVLKFGYPVGRAVALPAAQACRMRRVCADKGGVPWDA